MKLAFGNMWDWFVDTDLFLVTTNAYVKQNGELVMGRGIALEARQRVPTIDLLFGGIVLSRSGHLGEYGLIILPRWPEVKLGAFQVKRTFSEKASLDLIRLSVKMLDVFIKQHPQIRVALNFPGIGNGRLAKRYVSPIIETLPNNVTVWQYSND